MLEFCLAWFSGIRVLFFIIALVAGFGLIAATIARIVNGTIANACERRSKENSSYYEDQLVEAKSNLKICKTAFNWTLAVFLIAGPLATLPAMDDLWKVRIDLIKFELASPANIQAATETIERLGKKLECKYLGCDKKEEKKEERK